jgi:hypothetical protein
MRLRNGKPIFLQSFKVELNGFFDEAGDLIPAFGDGHAAGKVRDIGTEAGRSFFDDDEVLQVQTSILGA